MRACLRPYFLFLVVGLLICFCLDHWIGPLTKLCRHFGLVEITPLINQYSTNLYTIDLTNDFINQEFHSTTHYGSVSYAVITFEELHPPSFYVYSKASKGHLFKR